MVHEYAISPIPAFLPETQYLLGRLAQGVGAVAAFVRGCLPSALSVHANPGDRDGPRDCVLLIDASPSMDETDWKPSRLDAAQKAANAYAERLAGEEPAARIAVVAYCATATVLCSLTSVSNLNRIKRSIADISTDDWTNITAGLEAAICLLRGSARPCQVVLLSDGHHNHGPGPDTVADTLKQLAIIECVGIGTHHNVDEKLLKEVASAYPDGAKRYRWIGDPEQLVKHFHNLAGRITQA